MNSDGETSTRKPEDDMLPDEREAIADRMGDLEELGDEEYLSLDEVAASFGIELE